MATPVAAPRRSPPTIMTPSTFTQDISRAIMASSQVPKSINLELNPQANLEFPPPPPPPSPQQLIRRAVLNILGSADIVT
ncbi:hypothetical protein P168DRAFT_319470 [Aspergillus campestris IBT 28561]|uniref:Uncharacterized protein n=1 Tax=Aspergillus campestris (strain IBT 28561) TaxID=1392248 RepID=A0A2I1CZ87_ASPC2|nr:uncharacterized protein P168DRAFT_319470 [Aspergillus campestris IBT 28561]PKY02926.1 hypothetical protein P168DRAFT_319470 [Aspergillus campestris IBT 28561]